MPKKRLSGLSLFILLLFFLCTPSQANTFLDLGAGVQVLVHEILEQVRPREAMVLEVIHDEIYINLGRDEVSVGQLFEVFGVGEVIVDPITQEVLGTTEELRGTLEIIRVRERTSTGRVTKELRAPIQPGDMVYQKIDEERRTVAVYRFATALGEISELSWNLQEMVISHLARTHIFQVIERQQIDQLLEEYHFSYLGLIEESTAQEAGLLLGADTVIMGSLSDLGESIEIHARLTETVTGRTIATSSVRIQKDSVLERMLHRILEKEREREEPVHERETREILLTGIRIFPRLGEIHQGREMTFLARGIDQYGEEIPISPTWRVQGGVGEVYPSRGDQVRFTASFIGEGELMVELGALRAMVPLKVMPPPRVLTSLELIPGNIDLEPGEGIRIIARGRDQYGEIIETEPHWYVLQDIGRVIPEKGREAFFTATQPGKGTLLAEASGIRALIPIEVHEIPVLTRLEIIKEEDIFMRGQTYTLQGKGFDQFGDEMHITPFWSISQGLGDLQFFHGRTTSFEAQRIGDGVINISVGNVSTSLPIRVIEPPLERLVVEPGEIRLKVGDSRSIYVRGYDIFGARKDIEVQWTLDGEMGTLHNLSHDRVHFQALRGGTGFLITQVGDIVKRVPITIQESIPSTIIISPGDGQLLLGKRQSFTATVFDEDNEIMDVTVDWHVVGDLGRVLIIGNTIELLPNRRSSGILKATYRDIGTEVIVHVSYRGIGLMFAEAKELDRYLPVFTLSSGTGSRGREIGLSYQQIAIEREPAHLLWFQYVHTFFLRDKKPAPYLALRSQLGLGYYREDSSLAGEFTLITLDQGLEGGLQIPLGHRWELLPSYGISFDGGGFFSDYLGIEGEKKIGDLVRSYFNLSLRLLF